MSTFKSNVTVNKPLADVQHFLADLNNHQQLMPDGVSNWSSTTDTASFMVQGMLTLSLKISSKTANEIHIIPAEKAPFELELVWQLAEDGSGTKVTYTISAGLNMMMKMMASGPLQKLADHEVQTLAKVMA